MEFMIYNKAGSEVDHDEFIEILLDKIQAGLNQATLARKWFESNKFKESEVRSIIVDSINKAMNSVDRITKVRVKP